MRLAVEHLAIDRDLLARPDPHAVTHDDGGNRHFGEAVAAKHMGRLRLQANQMADGLSGPAARPGLEDTSRKHQHDNDGRGFEIDMVGPGRQRLGEERGDQRIEIGGRRAQHDQRVHVGREADEIGKALGEETPAGKGEHDGGEHQLDEPVGLFIDDAHHEMVEGRKQMAAHFDDEERQGGDDGDGQIPAQATRVFGAPCLLVRRAGRPGVVVAQTVAGLAHRAVERGQRQIGGHLEMHGFAGEVGGGRQHARNGAERLFHPRNARRAGHALDRQIATDGARRIAGLFDGGKDWCRCCRAGKAYGRALGGKVDAGTRHARNRSNGFLDPPHAGGAGHAIDADVEGVFGRARGFRSHLSRVLVGQLPIQIDLPIMARSRGPGSIVGSAARGPESWPPAGTKLGL